MQMQQDVSDEQLVGFVCSGELDRYELIIRRYQQKLLRYALYLTNDEQLAADIVQEAFIKAYVNLNSFNQHLTFSSWMYRIVHNQAMNAVHKNRQHVSIDEVMHLESNDNLEDEYIRQELSAHLHHCIEQMPILYKAPLTLYFLEEKTYVEISDILRIPIGTVGTRINRAKSMMRKVCQKK